MERPDRVQLGDVMTDFSLRVDEIHLSPTHPDLAVALTFIGGTEGTVLRFGFDRDGALGLADRLREILAGS